MARTSRRARPRGFTLVELMVVIGIIGILVGLLFPVLAGARRRAIDRKAHNTMRSIVQALEAYKQDFRRLPPDDFPFSDKGSEEAEGRTGSKNLYYYLCQSFAIGERRVGPFLELPEAQVQLDSGDGEKMFISPYVYIDRTVLHPYIYRRLDPMKEPGYSSLNPKPENFIVVDFGMDGVLGDGFKSDDPKQYPDYIVFERQDSPVNLEGLPASQDDIMSGE
jgi:prepilin-type N-terminal cleavage/methylation domain-containing protein